MEQSPLRIMSVFRQLGLTEDAASIYLDLIKHDASLIVDIAKRLWFHRAKIYREIPLLLEKGIISEVIRWKRKYYIAESPKSLYGLFAHFQRDLEMTIDALEKNYTPLKNRPIAYRYDGREWITTIFADLVHSLPEWWVFYRYSWPDNLWAREEYLPKDYRSVRDAKWLERMVITRRDISAQKSKRLERDMAIVPKGMSLLEDNITQLIYNDKVAIIDYNSDSAIVIENPLIAEFQKKIFKCMFQLLKKSEK